MALMHTAGVEEHMDLQLSVTLCLPPTNALAKLHASYTGTLWNFIEQRTTRKSYQCLWINGL